MWAIFFLFMTVINFAMVLVVVSEGLPKFLLWGFTLAGFCTFIGYLSQIQS